MYNREKAVQFALAQVNKPYVFGADGPNAFDCSGLTAAAVQAGGGPVLPHNSSMQAEFLRAVRATTANLKLMLPGDVLFWYGSINNYGSISHCGLFIHRGLRGRMVVAAVDEQYGVKKHRMKWALAPIGVGFVGH